MTPMEEFLSKLDPKTAKRVRMAHEVETVRLPLASVNLTRDLNGGIGAGRVTLLYGNTSAGKSVLAMQSVALWQRMGLSCAYVDAEGTWDKTWAARLGIDNENLILIQGKSSGKVEKEIKPFLESGIDAIVIDSVSDILAEVFVEPDGSLSENRKQVGAHAKSITNLINGIHYMNEKTAVLVISQTTTKFEQTYVKQVPHGGQKILFASSQIIKLTSSNTEGQQKKGEVTLGDVVIDAPIGREVEYYVEKNKLGRQSGKGKYDLYYAGDFVGIDTVGESVDAGEKYGLIKKSGAWMTLLSTGQQYQGRAKLVTALREDEALLKSLNDDINLALTGEVVD